MVHDFELHEFFLSQKNVHLKALLYVEYKEETILISITSLVENNYVYIFDKNL